MPRRKLQGQELADGVFIYTSCCITFSVTEVCAYLGCTACHVELLRAGVLLQDARPAAHAQLQGIDGRSSSQFKTTAGAVHAPAHVY